MPATLPSLETVESNLRAVRQSATADQIRDGRDWYPSTCILAADLASEAFDLTGDPITLEFAAGVLAALSQNTTWQANVTMARKYLCGLTAPGSRGMMASVAAEIDAMENGADPADAIGHLKRPDFYRNIIGDHSYVTCDRWHLRAAFGLGEIDASDRASMPAWCKRTRTAKTAPWTPAMDLTPEVRDLVTRATANVAAEFGESPAECQAVIWCAVRGDGK